MAASNSGSERNISRERFKLSRYGSSCGTGLLVLALELVVPSNDVPCMMFSTDWHSGKDCRDSIVDGGRR